jgi:hypothetical protein
MVKVKFAKGTKTHDGLSPAKRTFEKFVETSCRIVASWKSKKLLLLESTLQSQWESAHDSTLVQIIDLIKRYDLAKSKNKKYLTVINSGGGKAIALNLNKTFVWVIMSIWKIIIKKKRYGEEKKKPHLTVDLIIHCTK